MGGSSSCVGFCRGNPDQSHSKVARYRGNRRKAGERVGNS